MQLPNGSTYIVYCTGNQKYGYAYNAAAMVDAPMETWLQSYFKTDDPVASRRAGHMLEVAGRAVKTCNVLEYDSSTCRPDGVSNCTRAFQLAIADCGSSRHDAGVSRLLVPAGVFLTAPFELAGQRHQLAAPTSSCGFL